MSDRITNLAKDFWSVHPKKIQDLGITRELYYEQGISELVRVLLDEQETLRRTALALCYAWRDHAAETDKKLVEALITPMADMGVALAKLAEWGE